MAERRAASVTSSTGHSRRRRAKAIIVDEDLCKRCGICSKLCPQAVFDRDASGLPEAVRLDDCTLCLWCERHCPDFAVEVVSEKDGD